MRAIEVMFGVADNTPSKVVSTFAHSIILCGHHHLIWPNFEGSQRVKSKFEAKCGILQVCRAIDCTHILVDLLSNECAIDFFDKDKNYSIILQAIIDSNTHFLDIFVDFPRMVHDARVCSNLGFKVAMDHGACLNRKFGVMMAFLFLRY